MKFNFSSEHFLRLICLAAPTLPPRIPVPDISERNLRRAEAKAQPKKRR